MASESEFRNIVEKDLGDLRLALKLKLAALDEIKQEEERLVELMRRLIASIKEIEHVLENEVALFKKLKGGWEKAYAERRWDALAAAVKSGIEHFNREYSETKDIFTTAEQLTKKFESMREIMKRMNQKNVESRESDLRMLEDFKKQKTSAGTAGSRDYTL